MKISELTEPYRSLARLRETQFHGNNTDRNLTLAFDWHGTPERAMFWAAVCQNENPAIPGISLAELEDYT